MDDRTAEDILKRLSTLELLHRDRERREYTVGGGSGSGTDANAVHVNASGEIAGLTEKAAPAANDLVIIEDSAASNVKKKSKLTSILTALKGLIDHSGLANLNSTDYAHLTAAQVTDLTDGGATTLHTHAAGSVSIPSLCQGRLTLAGNIAIPSDIAGGTVLYWTPYLGNQIALYNGSTWVTYSVSADLNISLAGTIANRPYDVFCYHNGTIPTLELLAWTNSANRATALVLQDGVYCKTGALTRRYLGTVYINSSGGQSDDTITRRNVYNYYNRVRRRLYVLEGTSHAYNGAYRLWNNSETDNRLEFVIGVAEEITEVDVNTAVKAGADGSSARTRIYIDGSGVGNPASNYNNQYVVGSSLIKTLLAAGYHYVNLYEYGDHASSTFANMVLEGMVMA